MLIYFCEICWDSCWEPLYVLIHYEPLSNNLTLWKLQYMNFNRVSRSKCFLFVEVKLLLSSSETVLLVFECALQPGKSKVVHSHHDVEPLASNRKLLQSVCVYVCVCFHMVLVYGAQVVNGDIVMLSAQWERRRSALAQLQQQLQGLPSFLNELYAITANIGKFFFFYVSKER